MASNTKTFTAAMVMQLRDEGRLSLDDTLDVLVPEVTRPGLTIRQCLSHVSGMQREPLGDVWEELVFPDRAQLVEEFNQVERVHPPHRLWHYSNLAYSMLGEVVARLDAREWAESLRVRLLEPLEMRRTTVGFDGRHAARLLRAAVHRRPGAPDPPTTCARWTPAAAWPAPAPTWRGGRRSWPTRRPRCSRRTPSRRCASRRS